MFTLTAVKKTILAAAFSFILFPVWIHGQKKTDNIDCLPVKLPAALQLREDRPVKYRMTADYYNQDIFGNFFGKIRVAALYTRALAGDNVLWNAVTIANAPGKEDVFPGGTRQDYMENLRYNPRYMASDTSIMKSIPDDNIYTKNLIWDMLMFESFAWLYFDSLSLNVPYHARIFDKDIPLGGSGSFANHDVKLTWSGISKMNDKKCALIQFEAMENPLKIATGNMTARGRSHYWGNIWVSLDDKQLEGAWMNEDVMLELSIPPANKQFMNAIRRITVEKLNK
jgi:hypothetical protein